ncbi:hypothetical protein NF867_02810 [Solitalea sp. MAHUQ-68]|uniref:Uncharacterized protein n=1 Tax=Solitalea agri TaxID=2953739 RepID=A0A9X2JBS9_9SPHI|nr:hypothetical protein [Solitalea agri]MCO4291789.1 hypothetical protein [Solitalea agri]
MKTLVKTITVVSIATLTTIGTTKLNINTFAGSTEANEKALDIYFPAEENTPTKTQQLAEVTVHAYSIEKLNALVEFKPSINEDADVDVSDLTKIQGLDEKIKFIPSQQEVEFEPSSITDKSIEELIKFTPSETFDNESSELELNALIKFVPSEMDLNSVVEPLSIEQMLKFTPSELSSESIIEPVSTLDQLIKFTPSIASRDSEIIEPVSIEELVKFQPSNWENELVEEPGTNSNTEMIIK